MGFGLGEGQAPRMVLVLHSCTLLYITAAVSLPLALLTVLCISGTSSTIILTDSLF